MILGLTLLVLLVILVLVLGMVTRLLAVMRITAFSVVPAVLFENLLGGVPVMALASSECAEKRERGG